MGIKIENQKGTTIYTRDINKNTSSMYGQLYVKVYGVYMKSLSVNSM